MDILIGIAHEGHLRNIEWVVHELRRRGHAVAVATPAGSLPGPALRRLAAAHDITALQMPAVGTRGRAGTAIRRSLDALHHLEGPLADATLARERAVGAAPLLGRSSAAALAALHGPRRALRTVLERADRGVGVPGSITAFLQARRPEVLVVTPLLELGAPQAPLVRAAAALGIPSVALIASWDNLTMKGRLAELPDRVLVWNEVQRTEATALHGVPGTRVGVCGAWPFDHWFREAPAATAPAGPPDVAPIVYAGSSATVAPDEDAFIPEWLAAVRAGSLERWPVVVRPHPLNPLRPALQRTLERLPGVSIAQPGDDGSEDGERRRYLQTLRGSAAVVGINTTAFLEAAIAGRPTLAPLVARFHAGQAGTLHFGLLQPGNGGPVTVGADLEEHRRQLEATVLGDGDDDGAASRLDFVRSFIRPNGLETPATEYVADEIESAAASTRRTETRQ